MLKFIIFLMHVGHLFSDTNSNTKYVGFFQHHPILQPNRMSNNSVLRLPRIKANCTGQGLSCTRLFPRQMPPYATYTSAQLTTNSVVPQTPSQV